MSLEQFNKFLMNAEAEINDFLKQYCGITLDALCNMPGLRTPNQPENPLKSIFFQPYTKSDCFFKAISIITAPIAFSIFSVEFSLCSVFYAFKAIIDLVMLSPERALDNLKASSDNFISMVICLLSALISSIVNAIDLIGGGIATL